jgi:2-keto-4-pentenoate hydratase
MDWPVPLDMANALAQKSGRTIQESKERERNAMPTPFDAAPSAALLANAMNGSIRLTELPEAQRPGTIAEGYDIQDHVAAGGLVDDETAGWKLGLGSANAMRGAKIDRPLIGRVYRGRLHENDAEVVGPGGAKALIEIEIAFWLARDIAPGEQLADPLSAVERAKLVSEVVLSRFVDRTTVGLPSFAADSVGFHALVIGPEVAPADIPAIAASVEVTCDGAPAAQGLSGDDAIDPVEMLSHMMAHARDRNITLRKGELVTTGTLSKPFEAAIPSRIEARTSHGSLSYRLIGA